jgi:hypothetical protein
MNAYTHTLAKIAYQGNVGLGNFVQPVQPNSTVSTRNDGAKLSMNLLSINRMDRAMYGTAFWISAPEISRPLHKILHVERVEGTPHLVRKTVNRLQIVTNPSDPRSEWNGLPDSEHPHHVVLLIFSPYLASSLLYCFVLDNKMPFKSRHKTKTIYASQ